MIDLERELADLGDRLAVDDEDLVDAVLARLDPRSSAVRAHTVRNNRRRTLVAASILLLVVLGVLAVPSSRRTLADWFGLDGVGIERRTDVTVPADAVDELPPGIVVDRFEGLLEEDVITKVLGTGTDIRRVDVDGHPGLWIDGAPHDLVIRGSNGSFVTRRFAGNTLLVQNGDTIVRIEGAASLTEALALARELQPAG